MSDFSPIQYQKQYYSDNFAINPKYNKRDEEDRDFNPLSSDKKIAQKIDFMRYADKDLNEKTSFSPYQGT